MRLSTRGRYGARFMLDLALHYGEGPITLKDIAKRQAVSEKYLWNLIAPLRTAGLIRSDRGSQGGYALAKLPSEINLHEVVHAVEGPLSLVECVDNPSICKRVRNCVTRDIWDEISSKIIQVLESVTLKDMIEREKSKTREVARFIS